MVTHTYYASDKCIASQLQIHSSLPALGLFNNFPLRLRKACWTDSAGGQSLRTGAGTFRADSSHTFAATWPASSIPQLPRAPHPSPRAGRFPREVSQARPSP